MQKKPEENKKTVEQLAAEMNARALITEKRKFVKEKLFPKLIEVSDNIQDAQIIATVLGSIVQQSAMKKVNDLLVDEVEPTPNAGYEKYQEVFEIFKGKNIEFVTDILGQAAKAIDGALFEESKGRKLADLKIEFID